jgi:cytochrome P450
MSVFMPLETSFFSPEFTLDPFSWLEELYHRKDILGFSSEGMNFCFRYEDCRSLISANKNLSREPSDSSDSEKAIFAEQFPARAWGFRYLLMDLKAKAILNRFISEALERISLNKFKGVFQRFRQPGVHADYFRDLSLLPMKSIMDAWGFQFDDKVIEERYRYSMALVKSFDNYGDESLMAEGDVGMAQNIAYCREQFNCAPSGTVLHSYAKEIRANGIDDDHGIGCLVALIQSTPNTLSVSNTLMLRNMVRYRDEVQAIREEPSKIDSNVIIEFLRRDNHVKSLARQVHNNFELRGYEFKRGDSVYIFYPGVNLDPNHWAAPLALDFDRKFTHDNHIIFGGSKYSCIGSRIALKYFLEMVPMILEYLPASAELVSEDIHVDGSWVTERVITNMPIMIPGAV